MREMTRFVCVGHSIIDTICQVAAIRSTPTKVLANAYAEAGGGMAANASVAAARLGGIVHYWGRVGDDAPGERASSPYSRPKGCELPPCAASQEPDRRAPRVLVDDRGERLICTYNDPALDADATWLPIASLIDVDVVLADVRWPAGAARALAVARAAGVPAVLDGDVAPVATLRELCRCCDYAIFSQPV
ncbi:MAG TPA: PfkB family carbohydrate kinase [Casimicrobiaceae bacterium]|nr:PfkB family carbohydrate kinase [Casimicrobiaceae bacterium]